MKPQVDLEEEFAHLTEIYESLPRAAPYIGHAIDALNEVKMEENHLRLMSVLNGPAGGANKLAALAITVDVFLEVAAENGIKGDTAEERLAIANEVFEGLRRLFRTGGKIIEDLGPEATDALLGGKQVSD